MLNWFLAQLLWTSLLCTLQLGEPSVLCASKSEKVKGCSTNKPSPQTMGNTFIWKPPEVLRDFCTEQIRELQCRSLTCKQGYL